MKYKSRQRGLGQRLVSSGLFYLLGLIYQCALEWECSRPAAEWIDIARVWKEYSSFPMIRIRQLKWTLLQERWSEIIRYKFVWCKLLESRNFTSKKVSTIYRLGVCQVSHDVKRYSSLFIMSNSVNMRRFVRICGKLMKIWDLKMAIFSYKF